MSGRLDGRRAVVTGAASGIGQATAARLRDEGTRVLTVGLGGAVELVQDVAAPEAGDRIMQAAQERLGGLDILVNNAGVSRFEFLDGHSDAGWDEALSVNLTAVFRLCRAALPLLKASAAGRIVNLGSVMSSFGDAGMAAYAASKHGVLGLSRSLATELGPHGVTVNCVQPGAVLTGITAPAFEANPAFEAFWRDKAALKRIAAPEDVAAVIAFLASDDARFVTGHGIMVDGGAMQHP